MEDRVMRKAKVKAIERKAFVSVDTLRYMYLAGGMVIGCALALVLLKMTEALAMLYFTPFIDQAALYGAASQLGALGLVAAALFYFRSRIVRAAAYLT